MTNNYFPFKKVVLFCCFSLMLAMKPRALHTIRRFRKRLSKKVQKVLSFQMRRLHCFHLCQKLPQKIHITLCRKSPKLCSWIEVLLLFVLFCFVLFETGFLCVAMAVLELAVLTRLASDYVSRILKSVWPIYKIPKTGQHPPSPQLQKMYLTVKDTEKS